jgi:hypothetical protein
MKFGVGLETLLVCSPVCTSFTLMYFLWMRVKIILPFIPGVAYCFPRCQCPGVRMLVIEGIFMCPPCSFGNYDFTMYAKRHFYCNIALF